MDEKIIAGVIVSLMFWPLIIYFLFFNGRNKGQNVSKGNVGNKAKPTIKETDQPSLSMFSIGSKYPYVIESSYDYKNATPKLKHPMDRYNSLSYENGGNVTRGKSEHTLYSSLVNRLGKENIRFGAYCVYRYYPDIIYLDVENKIYVDIEIDEVYSFKTKEPIHYVEICTDENGKEYLFDLNKERDYAFKKYGWTVVRFSEEQVLKSVEECVDIVNHIVNYLKNKPSNFSLDNSKILVSKRWTKSEAIEIASMGTREIDDSEDSVVLEKTDFAEELNRISKEIDEEQNDEDDLREDYPEEDGLFGPKAPRTTIDR